MELTVNDKIDLIEEAMQDYPIVECPLKHTLLEDQYVREIFMPAGTLITSQIHKTQHPFMVLEGIVSVWTENEGVVTLTAGHHGVTNPGTRRVLYIHESCKWVTVHKRLPGETIDDIGERIIEKHDNPLLDSEMKKIYAELSKGGEINYYNQLNDTK